MTNKDVRRGQVLRVGLVTLMVAGLTACGGAADKGLMTAGTRDQLLASVAEVSPKLSEHERMAFQWAVSDINQTTLHRRYPNGSVRQVVRGEVNLVKANYPKRLAGLRDRAAAQAPVFAELERVTARQPALSITKGFFGLAPSVRAVLRNESKLPLGRIKWRANLYLNGDSKAVASAVVTSDFQSVGGLAPGTERDAVFKIGFVSGDESWTTLEVRNASERRVSLEPIPETAMDYGNKPYIDRDDRELIEKLEQGLQLAESYSDV
ncbi:hypothetical protein [Stenotrophomonas sp. S39]|uniref:hypothetical protein n=1 Tax=Stenotrophomonas sp. S39 TaxID=2767451 RepID=UPI001909C089|nr:hypothetical protein [Stenotrophomonas sp. S39]MBK0053065.1 hypothetical protein [Stenotrophomonas sp. S39]